MSSTTSTLQDDLLGRIRHELPGLSDSDADDLARSVARIIEAFAPEVIYAFGSHARGDAGPDSDVDLMVIIDESDEPTYRRAQAAFRAVGPHDLPLDILVRTSDEFSQRRHNPASLSSTVLREGTILYAA